MTDDAATAAIFNTDQCRACRQEAAIDWLGRHPNDWAKWPRTAFKANLLRNAAPQAHTCERANEQHD